MEVEYKGFHCNLKIIKTQVLKQNKPLISLVVVLDVHQLSVQAVDVAGQSLAGGPLEHGGRILQR